MVNYLALISTTTLWYYKQRKTKLNLNISNFNPKVA